MADFTSISPEYKNRSLVQASASERLIELLSIPTNADILDIGCGTGNVTANLREITSGRIVGIDQSEGMIRQARSAYENKGIEFIRLTDSEISFANEFDIVFCNSAFQWFKDPYEALDKFRDALRRFGKLGVQAPAKKLYCPNFVEAIEYCCGIKEIAELFSTFSSPWFFLDSADEYKELFEKSGLNIVYCQIETVQQRLTVNKVFDVFNSGAAAGYLNQQYFSKSLPNDFADKVLERVKESFDQQIDSEGKIALIFNRIYVVAEKDSH